tara:strand:+ start:619 stop:762 length:144 start_codon:yes stop_codon:yes gene_type:complete
MANLAVLVCVMVFLLIGGIAIVVYAERCEDQEKRKKLPKRHYKLRWT